MGFFSKLRGRYSPEYRQKTPDDDPDVARLKQQLTKARWKDVREFFGSLANSSDRGYYTNSLATCEGRPACFDAWVAAEPNCAAAWLVRGAHSVNWAWEARTGARAKDVDPNAWNVFWKRLQDAQADLNRAAELDPADPTCYGPLISAAMGLELERDVVEDYLAKAKARDPHHDWSHASTLWYSCKKWHGSHEEMFNFARKSCRSLEEGNPLYVLIPCAHFERWLYALAFDQDQDLVQAYWDDSKVHDEIVVAWRRSLGSSRHRPTKLTPGHRNFFALCLARIGEADLAKREFDQIGNLYDEFPWTCFGQPTGSFLRHREMAGCEA